MDLKEELYSETNPPFDLSVINDLGEAIIRVEENYCFWAYARNHLGVQKIERVFAYELYHQFKKYTEHKPEFRSLRLDGEINKWVGNEGNEGIELCGTNVSHTIRNSFSPDMVFHLGQQNMNEDNQRAIIEIKTKKVNPIELTNTILKLNHYIRLLHFQYAVFISVNTDFDKLIEQIRQLFGNPNGQLWAEKFKRIIVMNYKDRSLTCKTLFNILTDN